ncbi:cytochrome P460 family protein [Arhodomonas sp. SL1]|uniref:cytochrome P460 family protein n=1 Tax=Arhodomonas sp. SL1 TaxID=3425691 RepID=UPI003F88569D
MSKRITAAALSAAAGLAIAGCTMPGYGGDGGEATAGTQPSFGGPDSIAYAEELWSAMQKADLVGVNSIMSTPYEGQHPHGAVLDTIERPMTLNGHRGHVIVKRNYGGDGVSETAVANNPDEWLKSVTVMFRREAGYDPDNGNWFWAKYLPDGSLDRNPKDMQLAGRVAKGSDQGCIACHQAAPGEDLVFNHDRF